MELLHGRSLDEVVEESGSLSLDDFFAVFCQALDGMQHAHEKGVVHRDLKPSNLMLLRSESGQLKVKVVDFGIAKLLPQQGREENKLTQTGEIFGSPMYMSPEQCRGDELDARSDIYSLGAVMYEALTGRPPFSGNNMLETMYMHINDQPPALGKSAFDVKVNEQLEAIVLRSLAKDPAQRFQSAKQVKDALEGVRLGTARGLVPRLVTLWELSRLKRVPPRARTIILAIVGAFSILFAITLSMSFRAIEERASKEPEWSYRDPHMVTMSDALFTTRYSAGASIAREIAELKSPRLLQRLRRIANYCLKHGRYDKALPFLKEADRLTAQQEGAESIPYRELLRQIGNCYYWLGRGDEAGQYYLKALKINVGSWQSSERDAELQLNLGHIYLKEGRYEEALKHLIASLESQRRERNRNLSKFPGAETEEQLRNTLLIAFTESLIGDAYRLKDDLPLAEESYRTAVDSWILLPDQKSNLVACHYWLGRVEQLMGKHDAAAEHYRQAVLLIEKNLGSRSPYLPPLLKSLADALWQQKHYLGALEVRVKLTAVVMRLISEHAERVK